MPALGYPSPGGKSRPATPAPPFGSLLPGRFLGRRNRFAAAVAIGGVARLVHVPNSGRLRELLRPGAGAVCFLIQRADAAAFAPHAAHDPAFAAACRAAVSRGVLLRAYTCRVTPGGIAPLRRVPVRLGWRERRGSRSGPPTFWP